MRIGIDARFYGPESKGLGRYTQKLIAYLERIDTQNDYVIFLRKHNFDMYQPRNKRFVKVLADYRWYSTQEQVQFAIMLYKYRCDLMHFPHFNVPILYVRRFVVTIHDLILLRFPTREASTCSWIKYWIKFLMYRVVIYCAVTKAQRIIAVSHFTRTDLCEQYPRICKKISVIHEAAEIDRSGDGDDADFFVQYGIMKPYMLYAGNAYPHKNLHRLVEAFAMYCAHGGAVRQLVLVGKDDHFYRKLKAFIVSQHIQHVTILHTVSDAQLHTLYEHAIVFVFPSLYEGFGLPPLEAQLMKVPVLSHDHPCMREVLSVEGAHYCDASDVKKMAHAMKEIVNDVALRQKLIIAGFDNARKYSWQTMAQETYNIYIQKKSHGQYRQ